MKRIIKHRWLKLGYTKAECKRCGVIKEFDFDTYRTLYVFNGLRTYIYPECKSIMHSDSMSSSWR